MAGFGGWRLAALLAPLAFAAGCAGSGGTAQHLDARMQERLAPEVAARQGDVHPLPDGTRIELSEQALFPPGSAVLDAQGQFILASVIEGLMAPRLMMIEIAPAAATPADLRQARVEAVRQYFGEYALGPEVQQAGQSPQAVDPRALTVTVLVRGGRSGA